ncbi:hypothetical protein FHU30_000634 [Actinomadura rupiterrae]|nr:hypothetical protein [Actinomadura rupiterrae]
MRHFLHAWRIATRTFTVMLMALAVGLLLAVASLGRGDAKNTLTGLGITTFALCGLAFLYFATSPSRCPYCARVKAKAGQSPMPGVQTGPGQPAPPSGQPQPQQYGQPVAGQPSAYGQAPYGQPVYGGQPQEAQQSAYGQPPYGEQAAYGGPGSQGGRPGAYGQAPYGQPPSGGQAPAYGQPPYGDGQTPPQPPANR